MATTKPKESNSLGKERKISSPNSLNLPNTPTKRTPKSSPKSSSPSSSSSFSTPPNYLKSTASSRHEQTSKQLKKPAAIPESKPTLNRRRSFDKPPPTAPRLEKPFRSPEQRDRATRLPARSSSFGARPPSFAASAKLGSLERLVPKVSKVGKPLQPVQSLKSNTKRSLKKEPSNAASSMAEMAPKAKNAIEDADQCCLVPGDEEEEIKKIECELDSSLPDPMPQSDKETRTEEIKVDISEEAERKDEVEKKLHHYQTVQNRKISTVVSDMVAETPPPETKTVNLEDEAKSSSNEKENQEPKEGDREEEKSVAEEEVVIAVESEESGKNEEKIDNDQKEAEDGQNCMEDNNTNLKTETAEKDVEVAETAAKQRRKESPAVYNDVIEETASKLLETRKNKVKALAGAFQTVIDYESSSK